MSDRILKDIYWPETHRRPTLFDSNPIELYVGHIDNHRYAEAKQVQSTLNQNHDTTQRFVASYLAKHLKMLLDTGKFEHFLQAVDSDMLPYNFLKDLHQEAPASFQQLESLQSHWSKLKITIPVPNRDWGRHHGFQDDWSDLLTGYQQWWVKEYSPLYRAIASTVAQEEFQTKVTRAYYVIENPSLDQIIRYNAHNDTIVSKAFDFPRLLSLYPNIQAVFSLCESMELSTKTTQQTLLQYMHQGTSPIIPDESIDFS